MTIYLAAPLFSAGEKDYIDNLVNKICRELKLNFEDFYLPHRNTDYDSDISIYDKNIEALDNCDIMIAILDGKDVDSGTAFEIGYFESQEKIVLGLLTDKRSYDENGDLNLKLNTMIFGSLDYGNLVFDDIDDLIYELYEILMED